MNTFLSEALSCLRRYQAGHPAPFQLDLGKRGSELWRAVRERFVNHPDARSAARHNAAVLLEAANEYCAAIGGDLRHQVRERLERLRLEVDRVLRPPVLDAGAVPESAS